MSKRPRSSSTRPGGSRGNRPTSRVQLPVTASGHIRTTHPGLTDWLIQSSSSGQTSQTSSQTTAGSSDTTITWDGQRDSSAMSPVVNIPLSFGAPSARELLVNLDLPLDSLPLFSDEEDEEVQQSEHETPEEAWPPSTQQSQGGASSATPDVLEEGSTGPDEYDDDVADRTWCPEAAVSPPSSGDETEVPHPTVACTQDRRGRGRRPATTRQRSSPPSRGPERAPSASSQQPARPPVAGSKPRSSAVWQFFTLGTDRHIALCLMCSEKVSRGRGDNLGTTSMRKHMERQHPQAWKDREPNTTSCHDAPSPANPIVQHPVSATQGSSASAASSSTASQAGTPLMRQQSLSESMERRQVYSSSHPMAQKLTGHLVKMLVLQSLPFHLVDSQPFRDLMTCAHPRWRVPSRHYISGKAVPSLHSYVKKKVGESLSLSVSKTVHLSADVWSSNYGQGQYMSVTAHWVNILPEDHQEVGPFLPLSPPRCFRGPSAGRTTTTLQPSLPAVQSYHRCHARRSQAVLHLVSLGERSHSGQELLRTIRDEIQDWLTPRQLTVGNVVADNGRNIVSAVKRGGLTHTPCMAHVINLIVHRFIRSFPALQDLMRMSRRVCKHFSHSYAARNTLLKIQRQRNLPQHRLICDVPTRWNSALHMLDRLYEQRSAVTDYLMGQSGSFTPHCDFQVTHWQMMREVCQLLIPFEDATLFVSRHDYGINDIIPLVHVLESAQTHIIREDSQATDPRQNIALSPEMDEVPVECDEEEDVYGQPFRTPPPGFSASQSQQEMEDEVAEEEDPSRPWNYTEDSGEERRSLSLVQMAKCLRECLRNDSRIVDIRQRDQYWLATLVDPRFRRKMALFFPPSLRESKMAYYRDLLTRHLVSNYEQDQPCPPTTSSRGEPACSTSTTTGGGLRSRYSLQSLMSDFLEPVGEEETHHPTHGVDQLELSHQVTAYLDSTLPQSVTDPVQFWAEKLDIWPQLAEFSLSLLSCPASSVASERVFSVAGNIVTPQRTRLSCRSVEMLSFIKMNRAWITSDYTTPLPDVND